MKPDDKEGFLALMKTAFGGHFDYTSDLKHC